MKYSGANNIATDESRGLFRVARRAFVSEEILEAERAEIFDKCWLYLGHDFEVAVPGAFVSRSVGGRDLIFNRDAKGAVHAFLDACTHRGAKLCLERSGVAKNFQCIYHGWVFSADGKFPGNRTTTRILPASPPTARWTWCRRQGSSNIAGFGSSVSTRARLRCTAISAARASTSTAWRTSRTTWRSFPARRST